MASLPPNSFFHGDASLTIASSDGREFTNNPDELTAVGFEQNANTSNLNLPGTTRKSPRIPQLRNDANQKSSSSESGKVDPNTYFSSTVKTDLTSFTYPIPSIDRVSLDHISKSPSTEPVAHCFSYDSDSPCSFHLPETPPAIRIMKKKVVNYDDARLSTQFLVDGVPEQDEAISATAQSTNSVDLSFPTEGISSSTRIRKCAFVRILNDGVLSAKVGSHFSEAAKDTCSNVSVQESSSPTSVNSHSNRYVAGYTIAKTRNLEDAAVSSRLNAKNSCVSILGSTANLMDRCTTGSGVSDDDSTPRYISNHASDRNTFISGGAKWSMSSSGRDEGKGGGGQINGVNESSWTRESGTTFNSAMNDDGEAKLSACQRYLWSLKGITWGWGFTDKPKKSLNYYLTEFFAGLTVALSQVPSTMSFAFIAQVPIIDALNGTWITCFLASLLGGRPGAVTNVTANTSAVISNITDSHCENSVCSFYNLDYVFPAVMFAGLLILVCGLLRLSRFAQLIPSSIMIGFSNGIAIINAKSQAKVFILEGEEDKLAWAWVLAIIVVVVFVAELWPKIPKFGKYIPASVLALGASVFIEFVLVRWASGMETKTAGAVARLMPEDVWPLPFFLYPFFEQDSAKFKLDLNAIKLIVHIGTSLFVVIYISSLLTVEIISERCGNEGNGDQQLVGVGVANMVGGFLGSMGGATGASRSLLNFNSGGRGKESGLFAALCVFIIVTCLHFVLNYIPLAGLAGLILLTSYKTFKWWSIPIVIASFLPARIRKCHPYLEKKITRLDAFVIFETTLLTVFVDLGAAVIVGLFLTACGYAWQNLQRFKVYHRLDECCDTKYYEVTGPLFFATKKKFLKMFSPEKDPQHVVVLLAGSTRLFDYAALESINELQMRYKKFGKSLSIRGLSQECKKMVIKAGTVLEYIDVQTFQRTVGEVPTMRYYEPIVDSQENESFLDTKPPSR